MSINRKFVAWFLSGKGATGSLPSRRRSQPATMVGITDVRRIERRRFASGELSPASGSKEERAETVVRNTSIGVEDMGSNRMNSLTGSGSARFARSCAFISSSCSFVGKTPCQSK